MKAFFNAVRTRRAQTKKKQEADSTRFLLKTILFFYHSPAAELLEL